MSKQEARVACSTPTPGKQGTRIAKWKYDAVRRAILDSIPRQGEGLPFKDLPRAVADHLRADEKARLGSLGWYTTVVKLDLEVKKEIQRVAGARPQRLLRC